MGHGTHHDHDHDHDHAHDIEQALPPRNWQPIELMTEDDRFKMELQQKFPREAAVMRQEKMDRRTFMKFMGASMALAGFGMTGCAARPSDEPIIPYVVQPEEIVPGRPLFFASSMVLGGYATGILIQTHEGRPTRVEGNPNHPASLGGSNTLVQASVLELYNPQRALNITQGGTNSTWEDFRAALGSVMQRNTRLRILTETITSPTLGAQLAQVLEQFPNAAWYQYEPVSRDNVVLGARLAFGEDVNTVYQFEAASVVVSLDADFMANMPGSVRYARDFTAGRKVRAAGQNTMNRLYMVESTPTITGGVADHRLALRPSQVEALARALAAALGVEGGQAASEAPWSQAWFDTMVANLQASAGSSLVIAGSEQPPAVHALAHAINAALGNVGTTVRYTAPVEVRPTVQAQDIATLVEEMRAGQVDALVILGGDPVFNAPVDLDFEGALRSVAFTAHLSYYPNDTAGLCQWVIPQTHYIEEWSDARAYDGTASIVQPPIGALYDTVKSAHEVLAALLGDERSGYQIVRENWEANFSGGDFEAFWRKAVHDGVVPDSALPTVQPSLSLNLANAPAPALTGQGLEINFRPDPNIWDGRYINNSWLHELPNPLTKIAWDNAALVSRATAARLGLKTEDLVELRYGGRTMLAPVWVTHGHPDDLVTISLGYGRGLGADVAAGYAFNAYALRTASAPWFADGVEVGRTGRRYPLATVRANLESQGEDVVRFGTLSEYIDNPSFAQEAFKEKSLFQPWDYESYSWGMTIDLTSCIGCNACIIGCQTENNIPVVGKEGVAKGREMHWLRVDRYYIEDEAAGDLKTVFQPVPCMHCENAPCEQVCPVTATVHDSEGLNTMIYNRCVGTRYCSANCPYSVRRFNYAKYTDENVLNEEWRNPNVTVRVEGVMEKCTYCVQRIAAARIDAKNQNRPILDGEVTPACAAACPTQAITFGNLNDPEARVVALKADPLDYKVLEELNVRPRTSYLARLYNPDDSLMAAASEEG